MQYIDLFVGDIQFDDLADIFFVLMFYLGFWGMAALHKKPILHNKYKFCTFIRNFIQRQRR